MAPSSSQKSTSQVRQTCPCCHRSLHPGTVARHQRGEVPVVYRASQEVERDREDGWSLLADARPVKRSRYRKEGGNVGGEDKQDGGVERGGTRQSRNGVWLGWVLVFSHS